MTAKQLREYLEQVPDDMPVVTRCDSTMQGVDVTTDTAIRLRSGRMVEDFGGNPLVNESRIDVVVIY